MKVKMKFLPILIFLLFSCSRQNSSIGNEKQPEENSSEIIPKTNGGSTSEESVEMKNMDNEFFDCSNTQLKENVFDTASAYFSSPLSKDLFSFFVPKGNINETTSILRIMTTTKKLLYELKFSTRELVNGYALSEIKQEHEMVAYILKKTHDVLDKSSFIDFNNLDKESYLNQVPPEEFQNYPVLKEIKTDKRFIFLLAREEENIIYFGYDKITQKVVEIYTCC